MIVIRVAIGCSEQISYNPFIEVNDILQIKLSNFTLMNIMKNNLLLQELRKFSTNHLCTPEEQPTLDRFLQFLNSNQQCFERANRGHITSSIWIVNAQKTHALLTHHKKFNLWVQLGGHNDGESDCKKVAAQEALEESRISNLTFLHDGIFDIDIHAIPSACEYHYDIRYLMQAPEGSNFTVSDESHDLAWVPLDQISAYTLHSSVLRMNEKFKQHFL